MNREFPSQIRLSALACNNGILDVNYLALEEISSTAGSTDAHYYASYWMKQLVFVAPLMLVACEQKPAPTESDGNSLDAVLKTAYKLMLIGDYTTPPTHLDNRLIKAVLRPTQPETYETFYEKPVVEWKPTALNTKVVGNEYSE